MSQHTTTGKLRHGTLSKIAKRFNLSVNHVSLCAKGERIGRENLMRAIERERERQEREQEAAAA